MSKPTRVRLAIGWLVLAAVVQARWPALATPAVLGAGCAVLWLYEGMRRHR